MGCHQDVTWMGGGDLEVREDAEPRICASLGDNCMILFEEVREPILRKR